MTIIPKFAEGPSQALHEIRPGNENDSHHFVRLSVIEGTDFSTEPPKRFRVESVDGNHHLRVDLLAETRSVSSANM